MRVSHGFFLPSPPAGHAGCFQILAIGEKGEGIKRKTPNPNKTEQKADTEDSVVIAGEEEGGEGDGRGHNRDKQGRAGGGCTVQCAEDLLHSCALGTCRAYEPVSPQSI